MGVRARSLAVGAVVTLLLAAGCANDDQAAAEVNPHDVASGVVLDAPEGSPVADVEVQLLVWPAAQSSTASPAGDDGDEGDGAPQLVTVDTDVTDASGAFDLEALTAELTPHANSDGLVGIELRVAGDATAGTRTSVRLDRARDTGVTNVVATEDVVVVLSGGRPTG